MVKFFGVIFLGQPREAQPRPGARRRRCRSAIGLVWLALGCVAARAASGAGHRHCSTWSRASCSGCGPVAGARSWWLLAPAAARQPRTGRSVLFAVIGRGRRAARSCGVRVLYHRPHAPRSGLGLRLSCGPTPACRTPPRASASRSGRCSSRSSVMQRELPTPFDVAPRYRVTIDDRFWRWLYLPLGAAGRARAADLVGLAAAGAHLDLPAVQLRHAVALLAVMPMTALACRHAAAGDRDLRWCSRAPAFLGWVNQCRAWLQNKSAPSVLQPYRRPAQAVPQGRRAGRERLGAVPPRALRRLRLHGARPLRSSRRCRTDLPLRRLPTRSRWLACWRTARVFISLAAMDVGTAFGTLGARREMMIGFLAEPALLMVLFVASLISQSTVAAD